jgi:hypothetical protein
MDNARIWGTGKGERTEGFFASGRPLYTRTSLRAAIVTRVKFGFFVRASAFPRNATMMKPAVILKRRRHTAVVNCAPEDQMLDRNGELPSFPGWGTSWCFLCLLKGSS